MVGVGARVVALEDVGLFGGGELAQAGHRALGLLLREPLGARLALHQPVDVAVVAEEVTSASSSGTASRYQ